MERQHIDSRREGCFHIAPHAVATETGAVIMDRCRAVLAMHALAVTLAARGLLRIFILVRGPGVTLFTDSVLSSKSRMVRAGSVTVGTNIWGTDRLVTDGTIATKSGEWCRVMCFRNGLPSSGMARLTVGAVQRDVGMTGITAAIGVGRLNMVIGVVAVTISANNPLCFGTNMTERAVAELERRSRMMHLGDRRLFRSQVTDAAIVFSNRCTRMAGRTLLGCTGNRHVVVHGDRAI